MFFIKGVFIGGLVGLIYMVFKHADVLSELDNSPLEKIILIILGTIFLISMFIIFDTIRKRIDRKRSEKREKWENKMRKYDERDNMNKRFFNR